jgi:hypothetical protein
MVGTSIAVVLLASSGTYAAGTNGGASQTTSVFATLLNWLTGGSLLDAQQTGQPNQSCETLLNPPGNSSTAQGSAFNPDGTAGGVYAGTQTKNSKNPNSVSQYDVACARPQH